MSSVEIPLSSGRNEIQIQVWGKNKRTLVYTFVIRRDYIPGFAVNMLVDNEPLNEIVYGQINGVPITNPSIEIINSSSSGITFSNSSSSTEDGRQNETYLVHTPEDGSTVVQICIEKNPPWKIVIANSTFTKNACFDYDIGPGEFILSSSSSIDYNWPISSSNTSSNSHADCSEKKVTAKPSQIVYIDEDCHEKVIDIIVAGRNLSSSSNHNSWTSSSSYAGGESFDESSSSSNCSETGCISSEESSSSSTIEHKDPYGDVIQGTAIPSDFLTLFEYKLIGGDKITFANNANVQSGQYAANYIDVAAGARIDGLLNSVGNAFIGSNAYINTLIIGGSSTIQQGAHIDNLIENSVTVPAIPLISFKYGSENVNITSEKKRVLQPGSYESVNIFANAEAIFEPGVYRIKSLYIAPDTRVLLNTNDDLIQIWVDEGISIGDRTEFKSAGGMSRIFIYGNGRNTMYIGVNVDIDADIAYPNGAIELAPNSKLSGALWAKSVTVGTNVVVK